MLLEKRDLIIRLIFLIYFLKILIKLTEIEKNSNFSKKN